MKKTYLVMAAALLFLCDFPAVAQSTAGRKIEKTGKDIEKTGEAVEKGAVLFKKIFKKEDRDKPQKREENTQISIPEPSPSGTKTEESPKTTEGRSNGETMKIVKKDEDPSPVDPNELKPGDVYPNAVVLDVDMLYPFHKGAALVSKGSSTALINNRGEFIVPFNTYDFRPSDSANGFFLVRTDRTKEYGFITPKGKFISTQMAGGISGNFFYVRLNDSSIFYDIEGNRFEITGGVDNHVSEGLVVVGKDQKNQKVGYKNLKDQWVIEPKYETASSFMDGAAIVSNFNEYGDLKFGYIDTKGNPITPLQFTYLPMPFSNGFALVTYSNPQEYGFINRKGEVVFNDKGPTRFGIFTNGFAHKNNDHINKSMVMDKNWKQYTIQEFLNKYGIEPVNSSGKLFFPTYSNCNRLGYQNYNPVLPFSFYDGKKVNYGYLFWDDSTIIYGNFQSVPGQSPEDEFQFDVVSGLKRANWGLAKDYGDVREGYINKEGIFMIVKGEKSKW